MPGALNSFKRFLVLISFCSFSLSTVLPSSMVDISQPVMPPPLPCASDVSCLLQSYQTTKKSNMSGCVCVCACTEKDKRQKCVPHGCLGMVLKCLEH